MSAFSMLTTQAAPDSPSDAPSDSRKRRVRGLSLRSLLLWLFIAFGISLRFAGMTWDEAFQLHPDERFLTMTVPKLTWPHTLGEYFETRNATLNPFNHKVNFFIYGQLPLTLTKAVATIFRCDDYDGIRIVGRTLSALCDSASVLLLFFIGRRLCGETVGLLSAALLSFTVLHIQQSHFFVVDTFATFFLLAAFLCALRWLDDWPIQGMAAPEDLQTQRIRATCHALLCGFFWGASMACKIPCALFLSIVLLFEIALWRRCGHYKPLDEDSKTLWKRARWSTLSTAMVLIFSGFFWFRVLHPIAFEGAASPLTLWGFLDIRPASLSPGLDGQMVSFWASFRETAAIASGEREMPWTVQWIGQPKVWFSLRNMLVWAVGWPLVSMGIGGILLVLWRVIRRRALPVGLLAAAGWSVLIFFYYSTTFMKYTRYYLMITPFLALCAAWFGSELWHWSQSRGSETRGSETRGSETRASLRGIGRFGNAGLLVLLLNGFVLNATALWALACASIYLRPHPRLEASRWMRQHLPPTSTIAFETAWDDIVPVGGTGDFQMLDLHLYEQDDNTKRQNFLAVLARTQYIIVSSNRVWGSVPRLPQRWPMTTAYYHALFDGSLGFSAAHEWTNYPQLNIFGWWMEFPDDSIDESLSVYDHPRVLLFEKTAAFSPDAAAQILAPPLFMNRSEATLYDYVQAGWAPDENTLPKPPRARAVN